METVLIVLGIVGGALAMLFGYRKVSQKGVETGRTEMQREQFRLAKEKIEALARRDSEIDAAAAQKKKAIENAVSEKLGREPTEEEVRQLLEDAKK